MPDTGEFFPDFLPQLPLWLWFFLAVASIAIAYAQYLYKPEFSLQARIPLFTLRFAVFFGLLLLLAGTFWVTNDVSVIKKRLHLYIDASSSVDSLLSQEQKSTIDNIQDYFDQQFKEEVDFSTWYVANSISSTTDAVDFSSESTNLEQINPHLLEHEADVGILISDGIFNEGLQPVDAVRFMQADPVALYSFFVGDSLVKQSVSIAQFDTEGDIYFDAPFQLNSLIKFNAFKDQQLWLKWYRNGALIKDSLITISQEVDRRFFTISQSAAKDSDEELLRYELRVESEDNKLLNEAQYLVQPKEQNIRIHHHATQLHPDVGAIRRWLNAMPEVELSVSTEPFNSFASITTDSLDLLIVSSKNWDERYSQASKPLMFMRILGSEADQRTYLTDFDAQNMSARASLISKIDATLGLNTPPLRIRIDETFSQNSDAWEPLFFGQISELGERIPLIYASPKGAKPRAILFNADLWYTWLNYPGSRVQIKVKEFYTDLLKWLLVNDKNELIIKEIWPEKWLVNQKNTIKVGVLNESKVAVTDAIVRLNITNLISGQRQQIVANSLNNGSYSAEITLNTPELFRIDITATRSNEEIARLQEDVIGLAKSIELDDLTANPALLRAWSTTTGGDYLGPLNQNSDWQNTLEKMSEKEGLGESSIQVNRRQIPIDQWPYWFLVLLALLTLEWLLRKKLKAI